jgi:geranylgeranyl pyrophosphate synthase
MAKKRKQNTGGDARKINRDLMKCASYKSSHRRERNKVKKINHHLKVHIHDEYAKKKVEELVRFIKAS